MTEQLPVAATALVSDAKQTAVLNLVRRAAKAEILPRFRKLDRSDILSKGRTDDLVTAADTAAEAVITRGLQMAFPSALVVGEEAVHKDPKLLDKIGQAELSFIIDPVDGTWNFAHGLPVFGVMVAACQFGKPVYGLIYDPLGDDVVVADLTMMTRRVLANGRTVSLRTAEPKALDEMKGYVHQALMPKKDQVIAARCSTSFDRVSGLRCAAFEYRLLAEGAVDFVIGSKMTPWDHAAGVILCRQAGGYSAMLDETDYSAEIKEGYLLSASSRETWDKVRAVYKDLVST